MRRIYFVIFTLMPLMLMAATPYNESWFTAADNCSSKNPDIAVSDLASLVNEDTSGSSGGYVTCNIPFRANQELSQVRVYINKPVTTTADYECKVQTYAFENGESGEGDGYVLMESWTESISGSTTTNNPHELDIICSSGCSNSSGHEISGNNSSIDFSGSDYSDYIDDRLSARIKCHLPDGTTESKIYGFSVIYQ